MRKPLILFGIFACLFAYNGQVSRAAEVSGVVLNDIGRFVTNATVTLEKISDPEGAKTAVTDTTGNFSFAFSAETNVNEPAPFRLYGNYPNPFNPTTRISYSIDRPSEVRVVIYNALGQKVRTVLGGYREPGFYSVAWDGADDSGRACSAGVYIYRLTAGSATAVSKMLMMDSGTGRSAAGLRVPPAAYKGSENLLYTITVSSPDIETIVTGPMNLTHAAGLVLTANRIMDKMQLVHRNTYTRGSEWYDYAKPLHKVEITHDYYVDKYEVTGDAFCRVMNHALARGALNTDSLTIWSKEGTPQPLVQLDTPGAPTNICVEFRDGAFFPKPGRGKLPVAHVSWYGAMFFCHERNLIEGFPQTVDIDRWTCDYTAAGYRLPTDAEWELAAAWTERWEYAFGPDPGPYRPMNTELNADGFDDELSPVGWFSPQGDSHDGICDMSGNVYEWTTEWMEFYHQDWKDKTMVDPTGPEKGWQKTVRGGSAYGCFRAARTSDKASVQINRMTLEIGFRTIRLVKN
jgi:formylglycine-generating enzyme required for sulfatase activity